MQLKVPVNNFEQGISTDYNFSFYEDGGLNCINQSIEEYSINIVKKSYAWYGFDSKFEGNFILILICKVHIKSWQLLQIIWLIETEIGDSVKKVW